MISQHYKPLIFRFFVLFLVIIVSVEIFFPPFKFPDVVKGLNVGCILGALFFKFYKNV